MWWMYTTKMYTINIHLFDCRIPVWCCDYNNEVIRHKYFDIHEHYVWTNIHLFYGQPLCLYKNYTDNQKNLLSCYIIKHFALPRSFKIWIFFLIALVDRNKCIPSKCFMNGYSKFGWTSICPSVRSKTRSIIINRKYVFKYLFHSNNSSRTPKFGASQSSRDDSRVTYGYEII